MILALAFLIFTHTSDSCLLREGVGSDFARIGVTTRDKIANAPSAMRFNFDEHNVVTEMFVVAKGCRTSKGVEVGDPVDVVEKLYGKGEKGALHMKKGRGASEWEIGDYVLKYAGVEFIVSKN